MNCTFCGKVLPANAKFCPFCGNRPFAFEEPDRQKTDSDSDHSVEQETAVESSGITKAFPKSLSDVGERNEKPVSPGDDGPDSTPGCANRGLSPFDRFLSKNRKRIMILLAFLALSDIILLYVYVWQIGFNAVRPSANLSPMNSGPAPNSDKTDLPDGIVDLGNGTLIVGAGPRIADEDMDKFLKDLKNGKSDRSGAIYQQNDE